MNDLVNWRKADATINFDRLENLLNEYSADKLNNSKLFTLLQDGKLSLADFEVIKNELNFKLEQLDVGQSQMKSDMMTLEHYTERYIPIQMQQMIIENMKMVLSSTQVDVLRSEQNKMEY